MSAAGWLKSERNWLDCRRCKLHERRTTVVPGYGNTNANLMFVGEGPGANEDEEGYPFVGEAGDLLDQFLEHGLEMDREEVFLANTVMCRATKENERGRLENRPPTKAETGACRQRLMEAIYEVDPMLLIALGGTALNVLTEDNLKMGKSRGKIFQARVPGITKVITYPVFATYHPAFLLRNPSKAKRQPLWWTFKDFESIRRLHDFAVRAYKRKER